MTTSPKRPKFKMTLSHAAQHGTRRDLLEALRDRLIGALEDPRTQPRDFSPLTLRIREIAVELADIDAAPGDPVGTAARVPDGPIGEI